MTPGNSFFFAAGVLATVALLFVFYPWLAGRARGELLASLPRWVPLAGGGALAIVLAIYVILGMPQATERDAAPVAATGAAPALSGTAGSMDSAVQGLERRLVAGGGSDGDWELLAKSYDFLGRPDDAALARQKRLPAGAGASTAQSLTAATQSPRAAALSPQAARLVAAAEAARNKRDFAAARDQYAQLVARNEMNADTWADFADVTATLNGRSMQGKPADYLANALRLNPQHPKALWLKASMEHEAGQYQAATADWQRLATVLGADSPDANVIAANLAEDQRLAGGAVDQPNTAVANSGTVQGEVVVANALKDKIPAGLTLFIVAKSVTSPGPPVAIWRTATTGRWPIAFRLDDSLAMMPMRKLSTAGRVTIEARTSRTGQAMPAPGDFQGVSAQLEPGSAGRVRIVIEKVIG
ncbi:MAG: tetratricopeptide repeat protein [Steroidobacteraceae bacterium]